MNKYRPELGEVVEMAGRYFKVVLDDIEVKVGQLSATCSNCDFKAQPALCALAPRCYARGVGQPSIVFNEVQLDKGTTQMTQSEPETNLISRIVVNDKLTEIGKVHLRNTVVNEGTQIKFKDVTLVVVEDATHSCLNCACFEKYQHLCSVVPDCRQTVGLDFSTIHYKEVTDVSD